MAGENKNKKRSAKRKALRLAHEAQRNRKAVSARRSRADVALVMVRGDEELVIGVRRGLLGHPSTPILRVTHEEIAGALDDSRELAGLVSKLGVLCLAQLTGHNLAYGLDELAKTTAEWAGIDVTALREAAAQEARVGAEAPSAEAGGGLTGVTTDVEEPTSDQHGNL